MADCEKMKAERTTRLREIESLSEGLAAAPDVYAKLARILENIDALKNLRQFMLDAGCD